MILSIASLNLVADNGSESNCFCTCNCGFRSAYDDENPYYSKQGVEVMTEDGNVQTVHNFCDKKFYDRAKSGLCSPEE